MLAVRAAGPRFLTAVAMLFLSRRTVLVGLATWVSVVCFGCSGTATVQFVSLHPSEIDPPATDVMRFDAPEAYWWVDQAGEMNLAIRCRQRNLWLGELGNVELAFSLTPGPPPAGRARNYKIAVRESRILVRSPLQTRRFNAYAGILSLILNDATHAHGSFRIWLRPQPQLSFFEFPPQRSGSVMCFGTFKAVHDEGRGQAIRATCEADGWTRSAHKKPATTRPKANP